MRRRIANSSTAVAAAPLSAAGEARMKALIMASGMLGLALITVPVEANAVVCARAVPPRVRSSSGRRRFAARSSMVAESAADVLADIEWGVALECFAGCVNDRQVTKATHSRQVLSAWHSPRRSVRSRGLRCTARGGLPFTRHRDAGRCRDPHNSRRHDAKAR